MSTENTGRSRWLMNSMTLRKNPLTSAVRPVPRIASTQTATSRISRWCRENAASSGTSTTGTESGARSFRLAAASPATRSAVPSR